ncbi:MAG: hypothetical protein J0G33_06675 [Afipia felis]|nr:hypothetical protein [Afipia felis]
MAFDQSTARKARLLSFAALASIFSLSASTSYAGWFSSDRYDCENAAVLNEVKNKIACEGLLKCTQLGFPDLEAIKSTSPDKISAMFISRRKQQVDAGLARMTNPTEAEIRWGKNYINSIVDDEHAIIMSFQNLFLDAQSFTDDFNPNISRYSCRLTFRYNPAVFVPLWDFLLRAKYGSDSLMSAAHLTELKKNPTSDLLSMAVRATIQQQDVEQKSHLGTVETVAFTVQPSKDKAFLIDIRNVPLPGK